MSAPQISFEEPYRSAVISGCEKYRYKLSRQWAYDGYFLPIVMLNPSTADAYEDDRTIRRCMGFARREGYIGITVTNLFAFRATKPEDLVKAANPTGTGNWDYLGQALDYAQCRDIPVLCAWGSHPYAAGNAILFMNEAQRVGARLACLGKSKKSNRPKHPLYLKSDTPMEDYP